MKEEKRRGRQPSLNHMSFYCFSSVTYFFNRIKNSFRMRALLVFSAVLLVLGADPVPAVCANGGVLNKDDVTKCDCQPYFSGIECETKECVNGGYSDEGFCHCPKGYYGIHCDAVKQARPVDGVFDTKKSFNLYIHNELTDWYGKSGLERIQRDIPKILPDYSYASYNLFESKRDEASLDVKAGRNQTQFLKDLKGVSPKRTGKYTCADTDISYDELLEALKSKNIEDSVLLMYTQYPPKHDEEKLADLKKYLRAFRIKLNVIIGSDDILLDCNSKKFAGAFDELTSLVHFTDGEIASFLVEDDNDPNELLPIFIRSSASPQSHAREVSETCEDTDLIFQTDPYPNTYYIAVRSTEYNPASISGSCSSGGVVSDPIPSFYGEFTMFSILSGAQQKCTLSVRTGTECTATVYSVGGEKDVDNFDIFHSFSTSADMDTDSISSYQEEEFFLTMHIDVPVDSKYKIVRFEGSVTVKNEEVQDVSFTDLDRRSPSTYEYQSHEAFRCPKNGSSWIQLDLQGFNNISDNPPVAVLNRMIHLNCEERKPAVAPPVKSFRMMDDVKSDKPPTTLFSRFILEGVNSDVIEEKFTEYGYLRFDTTTQMSLDLTTDFTSFKTKIYDNAPDDQIDPLDISLKLELQQLTFNPSKSITSDSLVSIAISHSISDLSVNPNPFPSNMAELANKGARLVFWGDINTLTVSEKDYESLEMHNKLAAISAGHLVLIDFDDFPDDDANSGDFYVSKALRDLYNNGPSQRLLSYSNLEWTPTPSQTSQSSSIGTLQIPDATTEVFVSITLNINNPADVIPPFMLSIVLEGYKDRIVLNLDDFTQYGTTDYVRSNLYTTKLPVVEGESYDGTFTLLAMTSFTGAHIRFWTARTKEDVVPDLTYVNFDQTTVQPDDYVGAALRVPGKTGEKMSLRFFDEMGVDATLSDHNQTDVDVVKDIAHFIPYFCNSNQSKTFSKEMYTIEITYESGFKYFRPMFCSKGKSAEKNCNEGYDGNYYCTESNPPFHRGPSEKLIDCSGVGQVVYSEESKKTSSYKCICDEGFAGESCEQSSCAEGLEHLPEESDVEFRTLSYVLLSPSGQESCSVLQMFYAEEARQLFNRSNAYTNFWQYTFSMYFSDGTAKTLYRGPSFTDFFDVFGTLTMENIDFDTVNFCGNGKTQPFDLNEVYKLAVESVGRNSIGVVLIHAIQTFADADDSKNELKNAFASDELYQSIQSYQQHIYIVTPTMIPEFIDMTTASGGFTVRMVDDYNDFEASMSNYAMIFDKIFKSRIGWAGVSNEAKTNSWTINQKAEMFVTSRRKDKGAPPTATGLTPFTSDNGYKDGAVTQHASIDVTADSLTTVNLTFDTGVEYDLVQIVILTTVDPIRNALIGQSQSNTDKHAAGATNSSEKAVHISFNKDAKEFYFDPELDNWRQASRINCSYAQEFVAFTQPFKDVGPYVVNFAVSPKDKATGETLDKMFSLSIPLAVSERIDCVHGDFNNEGSFCECDGKNKWSGPTCSQPTCLNGGTLNSHGDHCDCSNTEYGGEFCEAKAISDEE
ncbi:hypothetical protein PRIPAC_92248 [Pristionchus pacificus]|uniref:Uncharacterized protein n=1 Tax=Pristionchus pacificus TaxID=54126 RepID=A0A2A6BJ44_PRIPA|nr:hypothetical protein PRIPAC_92248 [Pristionchus pacificus]|eukprot:PDM65930.1 hypothetical protein PRIPAC_44209 [Pristionchus pacificus]